MNQTVQYLQELTAIPSPTGFTAEVADYLVKTLEGLGYEPVRTNKGGVHVVAKGENDAQHRVVTAHVDTLGVLFGLLSLTVVSSWIGLAVSLGT